MRNPKHIGQRKHTKRRAFERYGLTLTKRDLQEMVGLIRGAKTKHLGWQSLRVSGHELVWQDKTLTVLYDNKRKSIITVLPEGAVWRGWREGAPVETREESASAIPTDIFTESGLR